MARYGVPRATAVGGGDPGRDGPGPGARRRGVAGSPGGARPRLGGRRGRSGRRRALTAPGARPCRQRPLTARPRRRRNATPLTPRQGAPIVRRRRSSSRSRPCEVGGDHLGLGRAQAAGVGDQELAGQRDRDVGVVEPAKVVLQRDDPRDELVHLRAERLAEELQRVAQPLRRRSGAGGPSRCRPSGGRFRTPRTCSYASQIREPAVSRTRCGATGLAGARTAAPSAVTKIRYSSTRREIGARIQLAHQEQTGRPRGRRTTPGPAAAKAAASPREAWPGVPRPPRSGRRGRAPRRAGRPLRGVAGASGASGRAGSRRRRRARRPASGGWRPACRGVPRSGAPFGSPPRGPASARGGSGGPCGRPRRGGRRGDARGLADRRAAVAGRRLGRRLGRRGSGGGPRHGLGGARRRGVSRRPRRRSCRGVDRARPRRPPAPREGRRARAPASRS